MKDKVLKWLSLGMKVLSIAAGASAYMQWIPEKWAPIAVLVFAISSVLKDTVNRIGDLLDDGQANNSFK